MRFDENVGSAPGVDALLFLFAAITLVALADRWPPLALCAVPMAALAGTTLPDLDMTLGLGHRSGLTHGVLPVLIALWSPRWRPVAAGLALGIGLHLSADVFPNGMRGFATVKLPGVGSIGRNGSWAWLAVNAVAALAIGALLVRRMASTGMTLAILIVVAVIGVAYLFVTDGGWPALLVYGGTGWALVRRRAIARS
ncbi:hypothetical protein ASG67_09335 [Sphingomonas sp. Leaf339]|uniref:zinc dependent phospholipase C family protein n=1 Tax=Sphingomonas sp. Leaf339 TaxID=1736343 RepID=UPI0006FA0FAD|nr:zinc dependent phospholipase C family protein [Sphingomonas sp. Leaf339]KQU53041.1 hypothetical protein ASG67_09335 [Sphingomonas sp. Leaf339]